MELLIIDGCEMAPLLDQIDAIAAIERAFAAYSRGEAKMPPKVYLDAPHGDFRAMPAAMHGFASVKWVNSHPENQQRHNLPTVMAVLILNDAESGRPLAIMDGTLLTRARTAAAAAVATKHLAKPNPQTISIVGCGGQAEAHVRALIKVAPQARVLLADASPGRAEALAAKLQSSPNKIEIVDTPAACAADVVTTITAARGGFVERNWIKPGAHINAMGADAEGKQELKLDLLLSSRVFVDDWAQASHSGEINVAVHEKKLTEVAGSICDVVAGKIQGRRDENEITIFDSTGLAIQDLALAEALYNAAQKASPRRIPFALGSDL